MSNCATKHDANFKIPCCTDHIDDGNKNAFLLYIGTNTNMSSYLHDLYEYDETENENEMKIYEALDLQMPMNMKYEDKKMKAHNENEMNTEYVSEYLNINPSKMNEWILYKTATQKYNDMNIASQSLNENEYEYNKNEYKEYKKGKNEIYVHNTNMGNYNDEIYGSINIKRALEDTQDVYNMPLQIEYGLFEDRLEIMNIMYLIENDMLASNINNVIKSENTWYVDDILNHLLHTCYQHVESNNKQGFTCHPDNFKLYNSDNQTTNNSYLYYKQTNSLVLSIPNHTEIQHTHINPLTLNTTYLPTYHISLQYINQHLHIYNTNKIWHNTYLNGNLIKL